MDGAATVYVADRYNNTIRKITPAGVVSTLAGLAGNSGSTDGTGSAARFSSPDSVAVDSAGNVYVADSGNYTIRKITPAGVVSTLAGSARNQGSVDGQGGAARFYLPKGVAVDSTGNVYVADSAYGIDVNSGNHTIRKITPGGLVTTLAGLAKSRGSANGTGSAARFDGPNGVAVDSAGTVYVAEVWNNTIRKITPGGVVTTLAGLAGSNGSADGTGSAARFKWPGSLAVDSVGTVYVSDLFNNTLRRITPNGQVTTLAGSAGIIGSVDGTGSAARFNYPYGVAVDVAGNLYVADSGNNTIRKGVPGGTTVGPTSAAPVLGAISDQVVDEGQTLTFTAQGSDPDAGQTLIYTLESGFPAGALINAITGVFTWTPNSTQGGQSYTITIRVTDNGLPPLSATRSFQITVRDASSNVPADHGDTFAAASPIAVGSITPAMLEVAGDKDYFRFTVTSAGTYLLYTRGVTDTTGYLYDSAWKQITSDGTSGESDNFRIIRLLNPGTYYVMVTFTTLKSFGIVARPYELHIEGPGAGTISDDHGFGPWSATPVAVGSTTAGVLDVAGDEDYFRFTVTSAGTYLLYTRGVTDTTGYLYDSAWKQITSDGTSGESDNFRIIRLLNPGTYYVMVTFTTLKSFGIVARPYELHIEGPPQPENLPPMLAQISDELVDEFVPISFTVMASDPDLPAQRLTFSLEAGAPAGATIDPSTGVFSWTPNEEQGPSTNVITVKVTDNGVPPKGATNSFTVVVKEVNRPPLLVAVPDQRIDEGTTLTVPVKTSDSDLPPQKLTFSLEPGAPQGAAIDSGTGLLTWTPSEEQGPSTNRITVRVTDNGTPNLSAANNFTVIVEEVNSAPVLTAIGTQIIDELTTLSVANGVVDSDIPANAPTLSLVSGPTGINLDPISGELTWTPTEAQGPSTNVITVKVTDNGAPPLSATNSFTVVVNEVNSAPVLTVPATQTINELTVLTVTNAAADADIPANVLTIGLVSAPAGASMDAATGILTWTPTEAQGPSTNTITVSVTDNGVPVLSATNSFTVIVNEVNSPPTLAAVADQIVPEGTQLSFVVSATDADLPVQPLTFTLEPGAPSGAAIDSATGVFSWTPSEVQGPSTNTITVRVTDNGVPSLSATNSLTVIVNEVNLPPTLAAVSDQIVPEGTQLSFVVSATDADLPVQPLTFTLEPGAPAGTAIDLATGVFSWTPSEEQGPSTNRITVRVTDRGTPSLTDIKTFTVVVNEVNSAPVILPIADKIVEEKSKLEFKIEATDPDIPKNALTFGLDADAPAGASIDLKTGLLTWTIGEVIGAQTNKVTVYVTDDGSPAMSDTKTFTVIATGPRLRLVPIADRTVNEGEPVILAAGVTNSPTAILPLTYSLGSGGPTNVVLNTSTGTFFWQTREEDGPSTNTISILLIDSGSPPATATQSFTVVVNEVNRAPVLAAIDSKTNRVGQTLIFQALATDDDLPANTLTYSLEPGAPVGATVDSKTGVFTWTPTQADAQTAHAISIKATDNASPALSDSKTFTVAVTGAEPLKLTGSVLPNGQFLLKVNAEIGRTYFILRSADLNSPEWELWTNVVATAASLEILDSTLTNLKQRFYRAVSP